MSAYKSQISLHRLWGAEIFTRRENNFKIHICHRINIQDPKRHLKNIPNQFKVVYCCGFIIHERTHAQ